MMYARLVGQVVAEVFTPPDGLSISDCFHGSLVWVPCDISVTPGWTAAFVDGSWTFAAPSPPAGPTLEQQANAAITSGLHITSTSMPTLNGTYAIDGISQGKLAAVSTYILVNSKFPGGATEYPWIDLAQQPHVFPTTATFQAFATAIADYVAALDMIIATGSGTLPPSTTALD